MNENYIYGVEQIPLKVILDQRGAVLHMIRSDASGFSQIGEVYFSEVFPGAVKAWKRHLRQSQMLTVPVGRILIVMFDGRVDSPTYMQTLELELGRPDMYFRLKIPPMVWYGFAGIAKVSSLIVNCPDLPHDSNESQRLDFDNGPVTFGWKDRCI